MPPTKSIVPTVNTLFAAMLGKYKKGIGTSSVGKYDEIKAAVAAAMKLPDSKVYATGASTRESNFSSRLKQNPKLQQGKRVALAFFGMEPGGTKDLEAVSDSCVTTCKTFVDGTDETVQYESVVLLVQPPGSKTVKPTRIIVSDPALEKQLHGLFPGAKIVRVPSPSGKAPAPASGPPKARELPRTPLPAARLAKAPANAMKGVVAAFAKALRQSHIDFGAEHDVVVRDFLCALSVRRFAIITGLSGSAKTQLGMKLGEWCGKGCLAVIPVRPDWTGPEHLFGYEDALLSPADDNRRAWFVPEALKFMLRASRDPNRPYILVLDEMNLAHVERYFADFLSGMESGKPVLPDVSDDDADRLFRLAPTGESRVVIPSNLFVIGTVNVDETTYMFSPKVLDRANTLEFRVPTDALPAPGALKKPVPCKAGAPTFVEQFLSMATRPEWTPPAHSKTQSTLDEAVRALHGLLEHHSAEFGYRTFSDAFRLAGLFVSAGERDPWVLLDAFMMQKVLPKTHGSRRKIEPLLTSLMAFCKSPEANVANESAKILESSAAPVLPRSFKKLERMLKNLVANQFVSFAE